MNAKINIVAVNTGTLLYSFHVEGIQNESAHITLNERCSDMIISAINEKENNLVVI